MGAVRQKVGQFVDWFITLCRCSIKEQVGGAGRCNGQWIVGFYDDGVPEYSQGVSFKY